MLLPSMAALVAKPEHYTGGIRQGETKPQKTQELLMQEPRKYTEKRHFLRMQIESRVSFQFSDATQSYIGHSRDFNAIGIRFSCDPLIACRNRLVEGTELALTLTPANPRLEPLLSQGIIVRVWQEQNELYVACRLVAHP